MKKQTIYILCKEEMVEKQGYVLNEYLTAYQHKKGVWFLSDRKTGWKLFEGKTLKGLIPEFKEELDRHPSMKKKYLKLIHDHYKVVKKEETMDSFTSKEGNIPCLGKFESRPELACNLPRVDAMNWRSAYNTDYYGVHNRWAPKPKLYKDNEDGRWYMVDPYTKNCGHELVLVQEGTSMDFDGDDDQYVIHRDEIWACPKCSTEFTRDETLSYNPHEKREYISRKEEEVEHIIHHDEAVRKVYQEFPDLDGVESGKEDLPIMEEFIEDMDPDDRVQADWDSTSMTTDEMKIYGLHDSTHARNGYFQNMAHFGRKAAKKMSLKNTDISEDLDYILELSGVYKGEGFVMFDPEVKVPYSRPKFVRSRVVDGKIIPVNGYLAKKFSNGWKNKYNVSGEAKPFDLESLGIIRYPECYTQTLIYRDVPEVGLTLEDKRVKPLMIEHKVPVKKAGIKVYLPTARMKEGFIHVYAIGDTRMKGSITLFADNDIKREEVTKKARAMANKLFAQLKEKGYVVIPMTADPNKDRYDVERKTYHAWKAEEIKLTK